MHNQSIHQCRPDGACVTKVPLPPVQKCQAGAGYSVTPGMVISADLAKSYCASTTPMNSLNSEKSDSSDSPSLKPLRLVLEYIFGDAHTELSPLSIARYLERMFSHDDISILQSRINKSLLIEVYNDATYRSLLKLQEINKSPVVIKPKSSVMSKGVFHCEETLDLTENERAQLESQGVIDLYRIQHTNMYCIAFNTRHLPKKIKISCLVFKVKLHVPKPRRCFRCQRYGHNEEYCIHEVVCPTCSASDGHTFKDCRSPPKCYHCEEPHPVTSQLCTMYQLEQLVLEYGVRNHVDFAEARRVVYELHSNLVLKVP